MGDKELELGCARPTGGPVGSPDRAPGEREVKSIEEVKKPMVGVGKKAPDFTLQDLDGQSVSLLCDRQSWQQLLPK